MSGHHCHLPGCTAACPPRYLMCSHHWFQVPGHLQADVYATVRRRGPQVDSTWSDWWRSQALAIDAVLRKLAENPVKIRGLALVPTVTTTQETFLAWVDALRTRELAFADHLAEKAP